MISIALATYNGGAFIERQLESLLVQTTQPSELVVCDDGSTDPTTRLIEKFSSRAQFPVRLHANEQRLGYRANFLKAASLCSSEYIAFCDQDDIWNPRKLEIATQQLSGTGHVLLEHGFDLIDASGQRISGLPYKIYEKDKPWAHSLGLTQIFHKSLLGYTDLWTRSVDHTRPGERMSHDQWISFLAPLVGSVVTIDDSLLSYRQHGANTFGWFGLGPPGEPGTMSANAQIFLSRLRHNPEPFLAKRAFLVERLQRLRAGAQARQAIIEELMKRGLADRQAVLEENRNYYRQFQSAYAQRLDVYCSNSVAGRLMSLISLYTKQQRWNRRKLRDAAIDLCYGVSAQPN